MKKAEKRHSLVAAVPAAFKLIKYTIVFIKWTKFASKIFVNLQRITQQLLIKSPPNIKQQGYYLVSILFRVKPMCILVMASGVPFKKRIMATSWLYVSFANLLENLALPWQLFRVVENMVQWNVNLQNPSNLLKNERKVTILRHSKSYPINTTKDRTAHRSLFTTRRADPMLPNKRHKHIR